MGLNKQIHLFSVCTDAFYKPDEKEIHTRLLKLYGIRKKINTNIDKIKDKKPQKNPVEYNIDDWLNWKKEINNLIRQEKEKLTVLLDNGLHDTNPRELQESALCDKNIVSLFESALTRALNIETNSTTKDIIIVNVFFFQVFENLVKNGFLYNGEKYVFLTASAGQIRTKKSVFIKESKFKQIEQKIMCGLTIDKINQEGGMNPNKFCSYLALASSATEPWVDFDIDKSIVVDDFETEVYGEVDYIDYNTYEITRKKMKVPIPVMDGAGIMMDNKTRMVRLSWIKGLMISFNFHQFIKEKCPEGDCVVYDIYGEPHKIIEEDIRYIFTKSQFKLNKFYSSWSSYKESFKTYKCEASYCNIEEDDLPKSRINYQMLQTLSDMQDDEIDVLIQSSVEDINTIGQDYQTTMRLLGATDYNRNPSYFQQSLMVYPELFRDTYCRDILKETKKSLVKQAQAGRLKINGEYRFVSPDLFQFCEWLFLDIKEPKGLLKNGEVYCRDYKNNDELACLRSPHLYKEWAIRKNKKNTETDKWFGCTNSIYTSGWDLITKLLQNDNDGDKYLVIKDKLLINIAKRNMTGVVPLYYEMKKASGGLITPDSLYQGMSKAYVSGNIGPISNLITVVHNNSQEDREEALKAIKWLVMETNFTIDSSKTLFFLDRPNYADEIIKKHTKGKLPNFFIYAKDKLSKQVELPNNSTMNRIAAKIPDSKLKFNKSISKFDYRVLMNLESGFDLSEDNDIIKSYDYWNARINSFVEDKNVKNQDMYKYHNLRNKVLEETGKDIDYIVNTLVSYLYTVRKTSAKKGLWDGFGDVILKNIEKNIEGKGRICPICGKRFEPKRIDQVGCSPECRSKINVLKQRERDKS